MEEILKKFKDNYPNITIEPRDYNYNLFDFEHSGTTYNVSGLMGNSEMQLIFEKKEEAEELYEILNKNFYVFPDFLAIKEGNTIEILLTTISFRTSLRNIDNEDDSFKKFFDINLPYYKNNLKIEFEIGINPENTLPKLLKFIRGGKWKIR